MKLSKPYRLDSLTWFQVSIFKKCRIANVSFLSSYGEWYLSYPSCVFVPWWMVSRGRDSCIYPCSWLNTLDTETLDSIVGWLRTLPFSFLVSQVIQLETVLVRVWTKGLLDLTQLRTVCVCVLRYPNPSHSGVADWFNILNNLELPHRFKDLNP